MKTAFFKTSENRQNRVIEASLEEFSNHSFREASLNDIIKRANISKGGMFKYIEDKAELYLYIVELSLKKLIDYQAVIISDDPCYIKRLFNMIIDSKTFYKTYPKHYQLLIKVSLDLNSPCYDQLIIMRYTLLKEQRMQLTENMDWSQYRLSKERVEAYLSTVMTGVNVQLLQALSGDQDHNMDAFMLEVKSIRDITMRGLRREI